MGLDELGALQGLITNELGARLHGLAEAVSPEHAIVEIGAYHGKSTAYLAYGARGPVYSVDPWSEDESAWRSSVMGRLPSPEFGTWDAQLRSVGLRGRVTPMQMTSVRAAARYDGPPIGLLYIDADHHDHAAAVDLLAWTRHLAPGAVVAWDDYGTTTNPGVTTAVHRLNDQGLVSFPEVDGRLAVTTWTGTRARLSASIMAHPRRQAEAEELSSSIGVPVVYDTNPIPSPDPAQRWATGRAAWEAHDPGADWHMVIQDDAVACADLLPGLEVALSLLGDSGLVSAYTGTGRPNQTNVRVMLANARNNKHSWAHTWSLNWGVAIIAPTSTITDMLAWCSRPARGKTNYDMRIGQYYRDILGWRTYYTHPSLVDHRDHESLVGHGSGGTRVAHEHHKGSALNIDWSRHNGLPVEVPESVRRKHPE